MKAQAPIAGVAVSAYRIPTDTPEADGTLEWDATTLVVVHVKAAGRIGLGYTYKLARWVEHDGCRWATRIKGARTAIGQVPLFVDANGAYGVAQARDGLCEPDWSRPGIGLEFKDVDARRYLEEGAR